MKDIIIYIAEVSLFLSMFFLIYKLFLQSATFFKFNRAYLITGLISSFVLPFISFSYDVSVTAPVTNILTTTQNITDTIIAEENPIDIWTILSITYLLGIMIFTIRNLFAYSQLVKLIKSGRIIKNNGYTVVDNENVTSPFTAFRYIILNMAKLSPTEQELVLKHEITHVTQMHWVDLICSQCALILQWFNPFVRLYISSLKENHEFLADRAVLNTGCSPILYQAVLINQRFQGPVFSFTNSFNYSNHLKRLTMMKKMKSSPWKRLAVLTLVPALGIFFWASATPNYVLIENGNHKDLLYPNNTEKEIIESPQEPIKVVGYKTTDNNSPKKNKQNIDSRKIIEQHFSKTDKPLIIYDGKEFKGTIDDIYKIEHNGLLIITGNEATKQYGEKGKNGVIELYWKTEKHKVNKTDLSKLPPEEQPLYIVDGKEVPTISNINPDIIHSILVLKDKSAAELYGEKGKNGVVIVELKGSKNNIYTYSGKVMTAGTENSISMASVIIKGTTVGTITDNDGNFTIKTTEMNPTLIFSNPGYKKQEIIITKPINNIFLESE